MTQRSPTLAPTDAATSSTVTGREAERVTDTLRLSDVLAVFAVPVVLILVSFLPQTAKDGLVLSAADPVVTGVTAHFVHLTSGHLLGNLAGFVAVAGAGLVCAVHAGRRREFYLGYAVFLFGFPPVLSAVSLPFASAGTVAGFSAILMAFVGVLPLMVARLLEDRGLGVTLDTAGGLFLLGLGLIAWRAVPDRTVGTAIAALAVLAAALYLVEPIRSIAGGVRGGPASVVRPELVLGALVVFFLVLAGGFPRNPVDDGTVVNVYVHLLGYAVGFLPTYIALRFGPTIEAGLSTVTSRHSPSNA